MKREYLKNVKSENRITRIRLIMPNDPVIGGQPTDNADDFTSNTPLLDIANTIKFAIDAASTAQKDANNADVKAQEAQSEAEKRMLPFNGYLRDEHINNAHQEGFYSVSSRAFVSKKNGYPGDLNRTAVVQVYRWGNNVLLQQVVTDESTYSRFYNLQTPEKLEWNKTYTDINTNNIKGFIRGSGNLIPVTEDQITSYLSDNKSLPASIYIVNNVNRDVVIAQKTANNADAKAQKAQIEAEKRMLPFNGYLRDEHINNANQEGFYSVSSSAFVSKKNGYPGDLNRTAVVRVYRWGNNVLLQQVVTDESTYSRFYNLQIPEKLEWNRTYTDVNTSSIKGFIRESGNLIPITEDQITSILSERTDQVATPKMVNDVNKVAYTAQNTANNADVKAQKAQSEAEKRMLPFNGYLRDEHINNANQEGFYSVASSAFISMENGYPSDLKTTPVIKVSRWGLSVLLQELLTANSHYYRRVDLNNPSETSWNKKAINTSINSRNGWWRCGDTGLIRQWGTANTDGAVNFPIAFPSLCASLNLNMISLAPKYADSLFISTIDKSGFSYKTVTPEAEHRVARIYWEAIGY